MKNMSKRKKYYTGGFIVHPWETGSGKYVASYGNHNKTAKSFKTLKKAKAYLAKHKIKTALYDSPSGTKDLKIKNVYPKKQKRRKKRTSVNYGDNIIKNLERQFFG